MRRTQVVTTLASISGLILSLSFSMSAFGYYQDKFNPNSPTYNPQNANYYKNMRNGNNRMMTYHVYQSRNYSHPKLRDPTGRPVFVYDPAKLTWAAYDRDGKLVRTGPGSGGQHYCADVGRGCKTPAGTYRVYSKAGPSYRSKIFPRPRGGAPMPYAMFFRGGYAVHGSYDVPSYNASHGCIRVIPQDAYWLNKNFLSYGSTVIVMPYRN